MRRVAAFTGLLADGFGLNRRLAGSGRALSQFLRDHRRDGLARKRVHGARPVVDGVTSEAQGAGGVVHHKEISELPDKR